MSASHLRSGRLVLVAACMLAGTASAQWTTPVVDGVIGSNEYGANNQLNNAGNTGQTWYMTWDAANLYVGVTNANLSEGAVLYINPNPPSPVTGGSNANGNLAGFNYDGASFFMLPFRATFVTYFKDGYREYRGSDGAGNWGGPTANYGAYASNGSGNVRELAIPWSAITGGGIPSSFVFFGYLTSSGGYVYGNAPSDNPGTTIGLTATYTQYFSVSSTANGASTPPFSNEQPSGFPGSVKLGFKHDTFDPFYRNPAGAQPENSQVTLRFTTAHSDGIWGVTLRGYLFDTASGNTTGPVDTVMAFDQNITVNNVELDAWITTLTLPSATTVYYYKFKINRDATNGWYSDDYLDGNDNLNKDGTGVAGDTEPFNSFAITVYDPNFQTPAWLQTANVYHIFPDRFRNGDVTNDYCVPGATTGCPLYYGSQQAFTHTTWNEPICDPYNNSGPCPGAFSNQFFGGDLRGIQNQLDYIQALGQDTLYLNPIFSARSNHRYDTDNYLHIDPALGGDAAFTALAQEMDRRGMRLILDGVFNHASSDGMYFDRYNRYGGTAPNIGACLSLQSMWRTWFHFNDNNVPCQSADYPGWFGLDSLPTWDHTNNSVKDFFYRAAGNVTQTWYKAGASGWRFDVADDGNFPRPWWHDYRTFAKTYKSDGPLLGEIWPDASQWLAGDQMDAVMNYRFRKNIIGFVRGAFDWCDNNNNGVNCIVHLAPSQFDHAIRAVRDDYPPQATAAMLNLLDSHDVNRALFVITELGDTGLTQAKQRLELAALFQFTYVGAPMVMYGDEVAINSPSLSNSSTGPIGDPYTRAPYPWTDQSGNPAVYGPPDTTVQSFYTKLAHMRKQYPVLQSGLFVTLLTGDTQQPSTAPNTYAFARTLNGVSIVVALNNSSATNSASIPVGGLFSDGAQLQDVLSGATYTVSGGSIAVTLAPITGVALAPSPVSIDLAPPTATVSLTPAANGAGWLNSSPVSANISATDSGGSGVGQIRFWVDAGVTTSVLASSAVAAVSGEGLHLVNARVIDNAGNISALVSQAVNIDLTPPLVSVTGVSNGATYPFGLVPTTGCQTTDARSGVAVSATVSITGGNGSGYGAFTATCSRAKDNAGNSAPAVSVMYNVYPPAPLSGTACNGIYTGTFKSNLFVTSGQNCAFVSGGVTGNILVTGGTFSLSHATVGSNVQLSNGGSANIGAGAIVKGNIEIQNVPATAPQSQICGAAVSGDLLIQNNSAAILIGAPACPGNSVGGNLEVQNNNALTQVYSNTVQANLLDQNNRGATQVFSNTVRSNLICQNDTSITGGGNTAKQKLGQCAAF